MSDAPISKGTVLIADDDANVLFFISKLCQPMGYATLTASSGLEALKVIQECGERIDLVLLDLNMPGMGGIEVLKSIRKHQPEISVIVLTALEDKQEECESIGVEAFMPKPYNLKELADRIEAVIERKNYDKDDVEIDKDYEPYAKILIVDDEPQVCELLAGALGEDFPQAHFEIRSAHSGDEALRASVEFEPDIAIVDIKMPHMWGDELISRFKKGEGYCPKDFVIYTSITNPDEVERARKLGHKMLTKPTNLDVLIDVLLKICVRHKLLRKKKD